MTPLICAACKQSLTMGIWDHQTEQVYCSRCIPPLPQTDPAESHRLIRSGVARAWLLP